MKTLTVLALTALVTLAGAGAVHAALFNGHVDYATGEAGYYAVITGGLFPNGQTRNGTSASGGVMRYVYEDTDNWWYNVNRPPQQWHHDDWFTQTSGVALTMRAPGGAIAYDNNGIETGTYPVDFYGKADGSALTPGLYCGFSMSNNNDWIYAGYFRLTEETTISQITGYFAETYSLPVDLNYPFEFSMNIFSEVDGTGIWAGKKMPANTGGFQGDVFSSDLVPGTFSVSDTGVDRIYNAAGWGPTDNIYALTYTLDTPITLAPGEYYFSHDARVIPEPISLLVWALLGLTFAGVAWRRATSHSAR